MQRFQPNLRLQELRSYEMLKPLHLVEQRRMDSLFDFFFLLQTFEILPKHQEMASDSHPNYGDY